MAYDERAARRRARFVWFAVAFFLVVGLAGDRPSWLLSSAPLRHPFQGARLFVDNRTPAAEFQRANQAAWLDRITRNPQASWINGPDDVRNVPDLVRRARAQNALPVLVTYYIPNRDCAGVGAPTNQDYLSFVHGLIAALKPERAAVIVEPDAVAAECFTAERAALLRHAVAALASAGHYVYLDAGHPGWRSAAETADRLADAGIAYAEGFSVNVANRQTTQKCYAWGRQVSRLLGGRDFVIDTSRNGIGPPSGPYAGHSDWCNPQRQALGEAPTTSVRRPRLAALLWIKPPGESDGTCGGEDSYGGFSPRQAENLIRNAGPR